MVASNYDYDVILDLVAIIEFASRSIITKYLLGHKLYSNEPHRNRITNNLRFDLMSVLSYPIKLTWAWAVQNKRSLLSNNFPLRKFVIFRDILADFSALEPAGEFLFEVLFIIFDALDDNIFFFSKIPKFPTI